MCFDGSCTKTSASTGVWLHNIETNHAEGNSYKLNFQCTNNIAEYEALLLGLHLLRKLGAKRIVVHGDSELIIRQLKREYTAKHPRLRAYRDDTLDLLKTFDEYELTFVPRNQNMLANALAISASNNRRPCENKQHIIQEKYRPVVPNNQRYWQVFEGDKQIEEFL